METAEPLDGQRSSFYASLSDKEKEYLLARANGEHCNMLAVSAQGHDERFHSQMLAFLLNPMADHGQGSFFLHSFMTKFVCSATSSESCNQARAYIEWGTKEKRRIDLVVVSPEWVVGIENKIHAPEQHKQIDAYWNDLRNRFDTRCWIVFLTLDGRTPKQAEEVKPDEIRRPSHGEVLEWLQQCRANLDPDKSTHLKLSVAQYCDIYDRLLGNDSSVADSLRDRVRNAFMAECAKRIKQLLPDWQFKQETICKFDYDGGGRFLEFDSPSNQDCRISLQLQLRWNDFPNSPPKEVGRLRLYIISATANPLAIKTLERLKIVIPELRLWVTETSGSSEPERCGTVFEDYFEAHHRFDYQRCITLASDANRSENDDVLVREASNVCAKISKFADEWHRITSNVA